MKIGLLAYHSACNMGATLQLLSSYGYWQKVGHEPVVINWIPQDLEDFYKMALDTGNLCILTGNANPELAKEIADHIGVNLCDAYVGHFNNGETQVMISESIRGKDIFIIQPTSYPVNDNLMELLIMADACKRASAHSVTAVVPYYAYARQDRKTRGREPISAKLVANLMTTAGVTRVVTVDLHAGQIQGFFDIPVDHLAAAPVIANYFRTQKLEDVVVVSPDLGGVTRPSPSLKSVVRNRAVLRS